MTDLISIGTEEASDVSNDEITFGKSPPPRAPVECGGSAAAHLRNRPNPHFRPMPPAQHTGL